MSPQLSSVGRVMETFVAQTQMQVRTLTDQECLGLVARANRNSDAVPLAGQTLGSGELELGGVLTADAASLQNCQHASQCSNSKILLVLQARQVQMV